MGTMEGQYQVPPHLLHALHGCLAARVGHVHGKLGVYGLDGASQESQSQQHGNKLDGIVPQYVIC
jgi:hypothetical protein